MKLILTLLILLLPQCLLAALAPWQGQWHGKCQMQNNNAHTSAFTATLSLKLNNQNQMSWHLQYQDQSVRAYTLVSNGSTLEYVLDENNGILIKKTLFPLTNSFKALFAIKDLLIAVSYQLQNAPTNNLQLTIDTFSTQATLASSDGRGNNVTSYRPIATQNCHFEPLE